MTPGWGSKRTVESPEAKVVSALSDEPVKTEMDAPVAVVSVTVEESYAVHDHQSVAPAWDGRRPGYPGSVVAPADGLKRRRLSPSSARREAKLSFSGGPG